jgi:hypothetical protein
MAGKSKNKYDVYLWIKDEVIPSCTTIKQNMTCDTLISNFRKTYNDYELERELLSENAYILGLKVV